jgi:hypothetical protein
MTTNGELKSSALQDELARIAAALETTRQDEAEAHAEIRLLARAAVADDGKEALSRIRDCEHKLGQARMAIRRLHDAQQLVEADLDEAIAQEAQTEREKDAAAATAYAETLPDIFRECDRTFAEFHKSFKAAVGAVNAGRSRGWVLPSSELVDAKIRRALRTSLSVRELMVLDLPALPPPERCSFASLGEAYARGIVGGAKHSLIPPPPKPVPQQTTKSEDFKMPPHGDIGRKLPGDGADFEVRVPARG